jgi:Radial spokehead-like protein
VLASLAEATLAKRNLNWRLMNETLFMAVGHSTETVIFRARRQRSAAMTSFEEARQQLQKESSDGVSLYDHLSEVLLKVLSDKTGNASEAFEQISIDVKQARHQTQQPVQTSSKAAAKSAQLKWATNAQVCKKYFDPVCCVVSIVAVVALLYK